MRKLVGAHLSLALALACPSLAWAQDEGTDGSGGIGEAGDVTEPAAPAESESGTSGAVAPSDDTTATASAGMGPFTKASYPTAVVDRPLTLPAGMLQATGGFGYLRYSESAGVYSATASALDLTVGAGYGVTDKLEVSLTTGLFQHYSVEADTSMGTISESDSGFWLADLRTFTPSVAYLALDTEKLDVAAKAELPLHFEDDADVVDTFGIGVPVRYMVLPQLALYTGQGLLTFDSVDNGTDSSLYSNLNVNLGVGYQLTPQAFVRLDTALFSLGLSGDGNDSAVIFSDYIPLGLSALYAIDNKLDVQFGLSWPDIKEESDLFVLGLAAAFRI